MFYSKDRSKPRKFSTPHNSNASAEITSDAPSTDETNAPAVKAQMTGARLRGYAFALLAKREYSKVELTQKLLLWAEDANEVENLVNEFIERNYQSDQRVAEQMLASQLRQGKGLAQIQQKMKQKHIDHHLVEQELAEVNWLAQAYALKCKKFGTDVVLDAKIRAKQVRFLQYRGFDLNICFRAVTLEQHDLDDES